MELGADGIPTALRRRLSTRSHWLIEELMILANRIACSYARRCRQPYIYRTHAPPSPLAIEEFAGAVRTLAPEAQARDLADLPAIRRWLSGLPPGPRRWRIHALFLQSLERAVYAGRDRGHFGLGLRGYGHFTSPIRRYPDLFNHRIVLWALRHGRRPAPNECWHELDGIARDCSATEERAERAERMLTRLKVLRWCEARLGQAFRGTIVGVLPVRYVVEFDEVPVEGFVSRVTGDATSGAWEAQRRVGPGGGGLQMGDAVIAQIARVDRRERRVELILRAAGRRADELDPRALEPVIDEREQLRRARAEAERRSGRSRARRRSARQRVAPRRRGRRRR
jgi:ribonuclease R